MSKRQSSEIESLITPKKPRRSKRVVPPKQKASYKPTVYEQIDVELPSSLKEYVDVLNCKSGNNTHFNMSTLKIE